MGELQIAYREAIETVARETESIDKTVGGKVQRVSVSLSVIPVEEGAERTTMKVVPDTGSQLAEKPLARYKYKAIEGGVMSGLQRGETMANNGI